MKKLYILVLLTVSLIANAQTNGPIVDMKYLPVAGTSVKQVWAFGSNALTVEVPLPHMGGVSAIWDYTIPNTPFSLNDSIYQIKTYNISDPAVVNSALAISKGATHATFLRMPTVPRNPLLPINNFGDSLWTYIRVDTNGVHNVGGQNIHHYNPQYPFVVSPTLPLGELLTPATASITTSSRVDTSYMEAAGGLASQSKKKTLEAYGYGTLKTPAGTFTDVLLVRELTHTFITAFNHVDTIRNDWSYSYYFVRNNTFGSSYLMWLGGDTALHSGGSHITNGWYSLPVDIGSIAGKVYATADTLTPVTKGLAYLYREGSNFAKNDILAIDTLGTNGHYDFDSIPYGRYRVAIRPDSASYPHALITYYGDTTDWIHATEINSLALQGNSMNNNIHLQYGDTAAGLGSITGSINSGYYTNARIKGILATKQIPGIGIRVKKSPGGSTARQAVTNASGSFNISGLADGDYELIADMPGLNQYDTCKFTISGASTGTFGFTVTSDSINSDACSLITVTALNNTSSTVKTNNLTVYPNPYTASTLISVNTLVQGNVSLDVYNVLGAKIHNIYKGEKQAGTHSFDFSAQRLGYASGMYFVKLTTGNTTTVVKIIEQ
ncbi:MAG: T9SS type A sorting domain-containing protein [Bacteroidia bacterium]